jgi:hypothetical protein
MRFCVLLTNMELLYYKSEWAEKPQDSILLRKVGATSSAIDFLFFPFLGNQIA